MGKKKLTKCGKDSNRKRQRGLQILCCCVPRSQTKQSLEEKVPQLKKNNGVITQLSEPKKCTERGSGSSSFRKLCKCKFSKVNKSNDVIAPLADPENYIKRDVETSSLRKFCMGKNFKLSVDTRHRNAQTESPNMSVQRDLQEEKPDIKSSRYRESTVDSSPDMYDTLRSSCDCAACTMETQDIRKSRQTGRNIIMTHPVDIKFPISLTRSRCASHAPRGRGSSCVYNGPRTSPDSAISALELQFSRHPESTSSSTSYSYDAPSTSRDHTYSLSPLLPRPQAMTTTITSSMSFAPSTSRDRRVSMTQQLPRSQSITASSTSHIRDVPRMCRDCRDSMTTQVSRSQGNKASSASFMSELPSTSRNCTFYGTPQLSRSQAISSSHASYISDESSISHSHTFSITPQVSRCPENAFIIPSCMPDEPSMSSEGSFSITPEVSRSLESIGSNVSYTSDHPSMVHECRVPMMPQHVKPRGDTKCKTVQTVAPKIRAGRDLPKQKLDSRHSRCRESTSNSALPMYHAPSKSRDLRFSIMTPQVSRSWESKDNNAPSTSNGPRTSRGHRFSALTPQPSKRHRNTCRNNGMLMEPNAWRGAGDCTAASRSRQRFMGPRRTQQRTHGTNPLSRRQMSMQSWHEVLNTMTERPFGPIFTEPLYLSYGQRSSSSIFRLFGDDESPGTSPPLTPSRNSNHGQDNDHPTLQETE
ncbi:serine-rich adhesin for platelets-like isoform X1 [Ambystoma mexicanum]|uniref:serine-rich adhesin for platelets-like isoform X1 n=1 Tax=Ambystoma mexicanum TaxID=8296 RepID=UPI0037E90F7B